MSNPIFDFNCKDLQMPVSDNLAMGIWLTQQSMKSSDSH